MQRYFWPPQIFSFLNFSTMKKLSIFLFGILISLTACQQKAEFQGVYSFKTLKGEYAELWADGENFGTIRESAPIAHLFKYVQEGDKIIMYDYRKEGWQGQKPISSLQLVSQENDRIFIKQSGQKNTIFLINENCPKLSPEDEGISMIEKNYQKRLEKQDSE